MGQILIPKHFSLWPLGHYPLIVNCSISSFSGHLNTSSMICTTSPGKPHTVLELYSFVWACSSGWWVLEDFKSHSKSFGLELCKTDVLNFSNKISAFQLPFVRLQQKWFLKKKKKKNSAAKEICQLSVWLFFFFSTSELTRVLSNPARTRDWNKSVCSPDVSFGDEFNTLHCRSVLY